MHVTPSALAHRHFDTLLNNLEGAFDADVESVHQARIATRRLREVLPLIGGQLQPVIAVVRSAGQQLGRVRELDSMSSLLDSLGSRIPTSAAADLHRTAHVVRTRRLEARRKMVKALEELDLSTLRRVVSQVASHGSGWRGMHGRRSSELAARMWERVVERGRDAAARVQRTRAVYFPNRAHRARIAIKKLRYALEVVADTGLWRAETALKDLRRLQGVLGDVHDLQVLDDMVVKLVPAAASEMETSPMRGVLDDDLVRHYAEYVRRRDRVARIADACAHAARRQGRWRLPAPVVVASALSAPIIVESLLLRARERA